MAVICPTVTAFEPHQYRTQMEVLEAFAGRVHIDLMDGEFAPTTSPGLEQIWWPENLTADIHLMYQRPMDQIEALIELGPSLVVIHAEAEVDHADFAAKLKAHNIQAGIAMLSDTTVESIEELIPKFDHVLIFSGDLGHHGGVADLQLLNKVKEIHKKFPSLEISWDGGINDQNAHQLIEAGVNVLNVGGYIADSQDPAAAYAKLKTVIEG